LVPGANGEAIPRLVQPDRKGTPEAWQGAQRHVRTASLDGSKSRAKTVRERYNVDVVGFRVDVVDGKVKLKAKPIQE